MISHQGHNFYLFVINIYYLFVFWDMLNFSIPEGFLRMYEQKEAYISFFLQDSVDCKVNG